MVLRLWRQCLELGFKLSQLSTKCIIQGVGGATVSSLSSLGSVRILLTSKFIRILQNIINILSFLILVHLLLFLVDYSC